LHRSFPAVSEPAPWNWAALKRLISACLFRFLYLVS